MAGTTVPSSVTTMTPRTCLGGIPGLGDVMAFDGKCLMAQTIQGAAAVGNVSHIVPGTIGAADLSAGLAALVGGLLTATGTGSATVLTPASPISAYAAGQFFSYIAPGANTGSVTINVSGKGAQALKKQYNVALVGGEILYGDVVMVMYDGTNFQLVSSYSPQLNDLPVAGYFVDSGAKNAYVVTIPGVTAYAKGLTFTLQIGTTTSDAAATLTVNSLAAKAIVTKTGAALSGGELVNGTAYRVVYDGTSFRMA